MLKFEQTNQMLTTELRERLIERIKKTNDELLLEEVYRLLGMQADDSDVYLLNDQQKKAIGEGRKQIKDGNYLADDEANREIDKWLDE